MEGDDTSYTVSGFDPNIMLPEEDVYKPKKKNKEPKCNEQEGCVWVKNKGCENN